MQYIVLDLEWNQTYYEKAKAVQKQLETRLRGEVIQIGAVKLNEKRKIVGSFSCIVRPVFFKRIHRHVAKLTHITQEALDHGIPLAEAMDNFRRFCGENAVFLTWGPDDLPMLEENLRAHRFSADFLLKSYDLQMIFNIDTDGEKRQRSLEYAMEHFGLTQNLQAHDALNDAYFTAQVAQHLHVAKGIVALEKIAAEKPDFVILGDADHGEKGFVSISDIFTLENIAKPTCPHCQASLASKAKMLHAKGQRYSKLYTCAEHGDFFIEVRVSKNLNDTFRAKMSVVEATEEKKAIYRQKLAKSQLRYPRRKTTKSS